MDPRSFPNGNDSASSKKLLRILLIFSNLILSFVGFFMCLIIGFFLISAINSAESAISTQFDSAYAITLQAEQTVDSLHIPISSIHGSTSNLSTSLTNLASGTSKTADSLNGLANALSLVSIITPIDTSPFSAAASDLRNASNSLNKSANSLKSFDQSLPEVDSEITNTKNQLSNARAGVLVGKENAISAASSLRIFAYFATVSLAMIFLLFLSSSAIEILSL